MPKARIISLETYNRIQHFDYFREMAYPYVGVTVNLDITDFMAYRREKKYPFFLSLLWYVAKAANETQQLRQRIFNEGIIEYDWCNTSHTVAKEDGTYCYCKLDCHKSFDAFIEYAMEKQEQAKKQGDLSENEGDLLSYLYVSSIPWVPYTSLIQPVPDQQDSHPRINWGKYEIKEGRVILPLSILCNHALVDGRHLGDFYDNLKNALQINNL